MKKVNKTVWLDSNGTEHATKGGMLYAERSARIFEYLLQQGFPKEHCWLVADIVADLKHWPRLQEWMTLDLVEEKDSTDRDATDAEMARAKDWPSMEGTPQERLQARRERVAAQDAQPRTGLCDCDAITFSARDQGTGCWHCKACGGVISTAQAEEHIGKWPADANVHERAPRKGRRYICTDRLKPNCPDCGTGDGQEHSARCPRITREDR